MRRQHRSFEIWFFSAIAAALTVLVPHAHSQVTTQSNIPEANVALHESLNTAAGDEACTQPPGYSYDDTTGVIDCNPIATAPCEWSMVCYYRRTKSCFPPETKIRMADKSEKKIADIRTGDIVWNPVRQRAEKVGKLLKGPEKIALIEIGYGTQKVHTTQKHPIVVKAETPEGFLVKRANTVTLADSVLGADGEYHQVEALRVLPIDAQQLVYNFEVVTDSQDTRDRMIAADGFVTGDVVVQARMNGDKLPWEK